MKKLIVLALFAAAAAAVLAMSTGCAMHGDCAYFQKTRGHKAHGMNDRIYNPNDSRYHERHATGIDSHASD